MDTEKPREQLWHRVDSESGRAYEAFKVYMYLPPAERTIVGAWRLWSDNPDARREPPFFHNWARNFAWSERARAHDHHLEVIRETSMEEAIKEEAARQARQVEQVRFRFHEIMSVAYQRVMERLNDSEWSEAGIRMSDIVKIAQLHLEGIEKLGERDAPSPEGDWEESEDEDDEIGRRIVEEVDAEAEERRAEEDDTEPEEGLPGEDGQN